MKITIYTVTDCQFSKQEKEYLSSHNLPYEEKNLELNKEWLTEMLAVSNNFAGTPVTRIEKDDGTIQVFKGFTKEEFDNFFGFTSSQTPSQNLSSPTFNQSTTPSTSSSADPASNTPPQPTPSLSTTPTTSTSSMNLPTDTPAKVDEKLGSVLDKLEEKTEEIKMTESPVNTFQSPSTQSPQSTPPLQTPSTQPTSFSNQPPTDLPNLPDFNSSDNQ